MSETLNGKVPVFEELVEKQRQFINGDENTDVQTDNGPVPSIAKALKTALPDQVNLGKPTGAQIVGTSVRFAALDRISSRR